jgi:acetyltransferase
MTVRNLEHLFRPKSVAVIGASPRRESLGDLVMRNLLAGGFEGPIMPVNPRHRAVAGVLAWPSVRDLPLTPDLAVICTPPAAVPGLVRELGERGTRAAIVVTAGLGDASGPDGRPLGVHMLEAARPNLVRILGPNCVGLLVPGIRLNASFAHAAALPGHLAFVSQSGALCTAVLDWAKSRGVGFSHFVSLGNSADVDFGDVIDYLAGEANTRAILLYIEAIKGARKFMSAARAAARTKPVVAIKAGRVAEGARAALSHTGAMAGSDDACDAALRRAGMLRVFDIDELFDAVETLAYAPPLAGERLVILTNGGGLGVLATDAFVEGGGRLAELGQSTLERLDAVLPRTWSRANPIDIIGDAPPERFSAAVGALKEAAEAEGIVFTYAPTATADPAEIARAIAEPLKALRRPVLASLLGGDSMSDARRVFEAAGLPTYETPEKAVRAFLHLLDYRRNQAALMETPPSIAAELEPDREAARSAIQAALAQGRSALTEPEAKAVLAAYAIPVVETRIAGTPADAARVATDLGFPVAVKLLSPDVTHKSDVGGVVLDVADAGAAQAAAAAIGERLATLKPGARLDGFAVQSMARRPGAVEVIVGATVDETFGPIILFGHGGTAVEVLKDRAVALPPLNMALAADLVRRTRVARLLAGYRHRPPAKLDAVYLVLVQLSQLVADLPEVAEIDINPLLADEHGVIALDARMRVSAAPSGAASGRLAIRPYPRELEQKIEVGQRPVVLRPIRPEDEPAHRAFLASVEPEDMRYRFFSLRREFTHEALAQWTQVDYDREMAFVATAAGESGAPETLGVVRAICDPDNERAEFAILVRSDLKGRGLGRALMEKMIGYLRGRGTRVLFGHVLAHNRAMIGLARRLGFAARHREADVVEVELALHGPSTAGAA